MSSLYPLSPQIKQSSEDVINTTQRQVVSLAADAPRFDETKINESECLILDRAAMEPRQMADGVFAGQARAVSGEVFYLRMERVTETNQKQWQQYSAKAYAIAERGLNDLCSMAIYPDWNHDIELLKKISGYTEAEIQDFVEWLQKRGFTTSKHLTVLSQNSLGSGVMYTSIGSYIIYAAKTETFSITQCPLIEEGAHLTVKSFIEFYQDIVMSVGSSFQEPASFRNMGIFRNPYNVVEGTHKRISLILHGFSGAVVQKYFPQKNEMHVTPISSMQALICNALKPEDYTIDGCKEEDKVKIKEAADRQFSRANMAHYPMNRIKVGALADLYYKTN